MDVENVVLADLLFQFLDEEHHVFCFPDKFIEGFDLVVGTLVVALAAVAAPVFLCFMC